MKNKLALKLAFILLLSTIIPLLAFGLTTMISARKSAVGTVSVWAAQQARQSAARIEDYIDGTQTSLTAIATNISQVGMESWQVQSILESYVLHVDRFLSFTCIDADGRIVNQTPRTHAPQKPWPAVQTINQAINDGEYYRSRVFIENYLPFITLGVRIPGIAEERYLLADLSLLAVWDTVDSLFPDQSTYAFLISEKGRLLAHSDPRRKRDVINNKPLDFLNVVSGVLSGRDTVKIEDNDLGEKSLFAGVSLPSLKWALIVEQPTKVTFAGVRRLQYFLAGTIIFIVALALIAGYASGNRMILRPVTQLVELTRRIGSGDFSQRLPVEGKGEFFALADSFNQMQDQLVDLRREIEINARTSFLSRIAAGLVHDLKHPFANIRTLSGLIHKRADELGFMEKYEGLVKDDLNKIGRFLDDLHNLARPMEIQRKKLEIDVALGGIVEKLTFQAKKLGMVIETDFAPGLVAELDAFLLERVINNLVVNSMQAQSKGGRVHLETMRVDESIIIRISDDGPGFPPERMKNLFEDFSTTKKRGLGLGLPLVKKFTTEMGGSIEAQSPKDDGAVFELKFPIYQEDSV